MIRCHQLTDLLRSGDELDHLLQCTSAVLIQRDLDKGWRCVENKSVTLFIIGILQKLLAQVVAERD